MEGDCNNRLGGLIRLARCAHPVSVCDIDLRVGGAWRFVNKHPKGEAAFHGEYLEIVPPSRLAFTEIFEEFPDGISWVTTDLMEEGGKTRMSTTVRYESKDVRDMVMSTGMEKPEGPTRAYLLVIDRAPDAVAKALRVS